MKKILISILAVFYLVTSTGATIHLHYCMGKLVGIDLKHKPSERCGKCGMVIKHHSKKHGCCKDEFKQIKNDKDQNISVVEMDFFHPVMIPSSNFQSELFSIIGSSVTTTYPVSNAPPLNSGSIYIRNCVFRI